MVLEKEGGIKAWRTLAGPTNSNTARESAPTSIRAQFGTDGSMNAVHGSDSVESAQREIEVVFGNAFRPQHVEPVIEVGDDLVAAEQGVEAVEEDLVEDAVDVEPQSAITENSAEIQAEISGDITVEEAEMEEERAEEEAYIQAKLAEANAEEASVPIVDASEVVEVSIPAESQDTVEALLEVDSSAEVDTATEKLIDAEQAVGEALQHEEAPMEETAPVLTEDNDSKEGETVAAEEEGDAEPALEATRETNAIPVTAYLQREIVPADKDILPQVEPEPADILAIAVQEELLPSLDSSETLSAEVAQSQTFSIKKAALETIEEHPLPDLPPESTAEARSFEETAVRTAEAVKEGSRDANQDEFQIISKKQSVEHSVVSMDQSSIAHAQATFEALDKLSELERSKAEAASPRADSEIQIAPPEPVAQPPSVKKETSKAVIEYESGTQRIKRPLSATSAREPTRKATGFTRFFSYIRSWISKTFSKQPTKLQ